MLVRLVYTSRAHENVAADALSLILASSRKNNPANGITGVLCTNGSVFLQLLEGGRDAVNQTYNRIIADKRHHDVQLLHFEEVTQRKFAVWTMGRVSFDRINTATLLKYSSKPTLDPYSVSGKASVALLEELMDSASVVV
jgi:hypothetical protein